MTKPKIKKTDLLQRLQQTEEILAKLLEACGWSDVEKFSEYQAEILEGMLKAVEEQSCEYSQAYYQAMATRKQLSAEQYESILQAIAGLNKQPIDYRDQFEFICEQVAKGVNPVEVLKPDQPVERVEFEPEDFRSKFVTLLGPDVGQELYDFLSSKVEQITSGTEAQMADVVKISVEQQHEIYKLFLQMAQTGIAKKLLSPEFQTFCDQTIAATLSESQKKPEALSGAVTPPKLLLSSS